MAGRSRYDDTRLVRLFEELDPKRRRQALKGAFRKAAFEVRNYARKGLKSEIEASKEVLKGIRGAVYRRSLGFRVTVGSKKGAKSRKEIVPLWMLGTRDRRRKLSKSLRKALLGKGGSTGRLKPRQFMDRAKAHAAPKAEKLIKDQILQQIEKTARKYGSTMQ